MNELDAYKRALEREKKARQQAERLLDEKTREAWDNLKATEQAYQELQDTKDKLVQSENWHPLANWPPASLMKSIIQLAMY